MKRALVGALLVTVGWLASPGTAPIYDGVGSPDEPYKYVGKSPAPAAVSVTVPDSGGVSASLQLKSSENGPQVLVDLGSGAFTADGKTVTLTSTPLTPDGTPPRGRLDGNVYRLTASPGAVLHPENTQGFIFLRAAVMTKPDPVIVHRRAATDPWVEMKTTRAGTDILSTPFRDLGEYSLVQLPGSTPLNAGGLSLVRVLLLGGGVLLLLTVTVLVLRRPRPEDD
ncbi:MAG: hypothetical protein JWM02_756 [Frankiales bacterium]|nr:hypothetical protein [Frankiales bacterium]